MEKCLRAFLAVAALLVGIPASASTIVLDFKSVGNLNPVGDFYNGGEGTNDDIEFSSPDTAIFPRDANDAVLNVPAEFDAGSSFFYSSSTAALVNVDDGLDATGNLLETLSLVAQFGHNCTEDPNGEFCNGLPIVAVGGLAKSIDFGETTNQIAVDTITPGSADPVGASVAERAILPLLGAGLGLAAVMLGRRRRSGHSLKGRRRGSGRIIGKGVR